MSNFQLASKIPPLFQTFSMPDKKINNIERQESANESKESSNLSEALDKVDSSGDIADLMEGVDMGDVSEKASEKRENKGDTNKKQGAQAQQDTSQQVKPARPLPSLNVMRRKVVEKMKEEQTLLIGELSDVKKNPYAYAEKIKQIRSLRQKIGDFLGKAADFIKDAYLKFFGGRHGVEKNEEVTESK